MQGSFSELDDDIGWNDFPLRNYDAQIGKWMQQDPFANSYITSSYVGMGNDPVSLIDPTGGDPLPVRLILNLGDVPTGALAIEKTIGEVIVKGVARVSKATPLISGLAKLNISLQVLRAAITIINSDVTSQQVGSIRLIFAGGAIKVGDNGAFQAAAKNVASDYKGDGTTVESLEAKSSDYISNTINNKSNNSILSLDLVTHGGPTGFFMYQGSKEKNVSMYDWWITKSFFGDDVQREAGTLSDIKYSKFTDDAIVEIHGCRAGKDRGWWDNIAEDMSEKLYSAGKKNSVVIAHSTKSGPKINGDNTKASQQDYRWGTRIVYWNGHKILETTQRGRITQKQINKAIEEYKKVH